MKFASGRIFQQLVILFVAALTSQSKTALLVKDTPYGKGFLQAHLQVLAATDFFTVELQPADGLIRHQALCMFREAQIAGIVFEPNERWINRVARKLTDREGMGF